MASIRYYFGGINASGKSTLLSAIKKVKPEYEVIHVTGKFMRWLGMDNDYERLRTLDPDFISQEFPKFIKDLLHQYKNKVLLLDSHYLNLIRGRVFDRTGPWLKKFDALVLVEADVDDILKRIKKEATEKDRALFPEGCSEKECRQILTRYWRLTKETFESLARKYGKPFKIITNPDDNLRQAVNIFLKFDRELRH